MGDRRFAWLTIGVAIALLPGGDAARAQERLAPGALERVRPAGQTNATQPSATSRTRGQIDSGDDAYAAPGIPPPVPVDDIGEIQPEPDLLDPVPRAGQRPVLQDGDLTADEFQPSLRDGIVDVGEPLPPEDGTDPVTVDTRPPEDLAVFENPPAGFDPLLFQIEDIDPILDNRTTTRLFRLEPFDPIGVKIGSFVLFPELNLGGSWYSNVFRAPGAQSDVAADYGGSARLVSNWTRHALEFRAAGIFSSYSEFDSENDKTYQLEARGRLDVTKRTNVQAILARDQAPESRSAIDASSVGPRATQRIDRAEAALNHRFNRLSLQFRGSVSDYAYGDTQSAALVTTTSDRDYQQTEETVRASWEFKPTLSAFTEVAVNQRSYDTVASTDLLGRSSDGQRYRAGVSFGNTGQILRGEVSLGYGVQSYNEGRLRDVEGFLIDANATWRPTELTSLLFTARSDVSETTTANVGGAFTRAAGVEMRHTLRRYVVASAGLLYTTQDSHDGIIEDSELRSTLGLEYFVNSDVVLFSRYAHINFDGVGSSSDYDADEIRMGVRLRR